MFDHMKAAIEKTGWFATAVMPTEDEDHPIFVYSSGFQTTISQPDVVMVGFDPHLCHSVIASLYDGLKAGRYSIPEAGGKMDGVIQRFPVLMRKLDQSQIAGFAYGTLRWNGDEPTVMHQMVLPDPNGIFPGEAGVNEDYERFQDITAILSNPEEGPLI